MEEEKNEKNSEVTNLENNANVTESINNPMPEVEKKKKSHAWVIILLIALLVAGCGVGGYLLFRKGNGKRVTEIKQQTLLSELRMSSNGLENFDLYFMKLNNDGKNKVYSPISIKYALEMLSEGAKGETKEQIDTILGSYKAGKYENSANMSFANAFFIKDDIKDDINAEYTQNLKNKFNAEIIYDSFKGADNINKWVSDKTLKLIDNILSDEAIQDKLFVIINALAIDMEWVNRVQEIGNEGFSFGVSFANEDYNYIINSYTESVGNYKITFNNKETEALRFGSVFNNYDIVRELGEDNIRKTVTDAYNKFANENSDRPECLTPDFDGYLNKYINDLNNNYHLFDHSTDYGYYKDDKVLVFSKDLKKYGNTQLQYVQVMPLNESLDNYIKNVKASDLNSIINKAKVPSNSDYQDGKIIEINGYVTPFKMAYKMDLIKNLNELGVYNAFSPNKADLSGIVKTKGVYVDMAVHDATIEFTNDGIKAAAVTIIGGAGSDDCSFHYEFDVPVEKIDLTFNKPFMYLIRDKVTGEVWFTGATYEVETPTLSLID